MMRIGAMFVMVAAAATWAIAAPPPTMTPEAEEPREKQAGSDERLLAGPRVPVRADRTLVRRDERGRVRAVEGRPDVAALQMLDLDPDEREVVRSATLARAASIELLLVDRLDQVRAWADARDRGDRAVAERVALELRPLIEPRPRRDAVLDAVAEMLPAEKTAEARRMLDEYWSELMKSSERSGSRRDGGRRGERGEEGAMMRESGGGEMSMQEGSSADGGAASDDSDSAIRRTTDRIFQGEVREAYERALRQYRERADAIERAVEPTDEQREMIRETIADLIRATRLSPTQEQRAAAVMKVYDGLDPARQRKLFEYLARQTR